MATVIRMFLSCLVLVLLATLQTADAFVNPRGERASSAHQGAVPGVKHDTNQVQTSSIRRPPSGPNPEGNFEVNAASQDVGKRGTKVQNVDTASVAKRELTGAFQGDVASKDVGKHDTHQVQITAVRRPPSGPNPEGNFEVNAATQDVGKHGTKLQNVGTASVMKRELTGAFQGAKDVGKHDTHQIQITAVRRPPSGPNPEGNFEVNAASHDVGKHGTKVQIVDTASVTKDPSGSTQG